MASTITEIPGLTIRTDANRYPGLTKITANFNQEDSADDTSYTNFHQFEHWVPNENLHEGIKHIITVADAAMDIVAARNEANKARLMALPTLEDPDGDIKPLELLPVLTESEKY